MFHAGDDHRSGRAQEQQAGAHHQSRVCAVNESRQRDAEKAVWPQFVESFFHEYPYFLHCYEKKGLQETCPVQERYNCLEDNRFANR